MKSQRLHFSNCLQSYTIHVGPYCGNTALSDIDCAYITIQNLHDNIMGIMEFPVAETELILAWVIEGTISRESFSELSMTDSCAWTASVIHICSFIDVINEMYFYIIWVLYVSFIVLVWKF